jgi:hypothetical protein
MLTMQGHVLCHEPILGTMLSNGHRRYVVDDERRVLISSMGGMACLMSPPAQSPWFLAIRTCFPAPFTAPAFS